MGEVLWDLLHGGRQLGGAPANFAYHAAALGTEARVVSPVGRDDVGRKLIRRLDQLGVPTDCVEEDPAHPTGTVAVEVTELVRRFKLRAWLSRAANMPGH